MKLSIIIPYYNCYEYIEELMRILEPQLRDGVEVIIVDDGCNEMRLDSFKADVYHLKENSGSASIPRNVGIDVSQGEYLVFVDADDMVSEDYVETILDNLGDWEYCYYSWKLNGKDIIIEDEPPYWNTSACNCIYKRSLIGDKRFNPMIKLGEDKAFNKMVRKGKKGNITKVIYEYRTDNPNSITYNLRGW